CWEFAICRNARVLRVRRGSAGLWLLCAAPASSLLRAAARLRTARIYLDWRILVPSWSAIPLARWLLGAAALCGRTLVRSALLQPSLLSRPLAPSLTSRLDSHQRDTVRRDIARQGLGGNAEVFVFPEIANTRRSLETNVTPARRHL